ncbi:MAG: hypothetical protein J7L04_02785 [Bacteroidales bacterium]|nr:hypothetical protein [Bacteroidales bacterium]
MEHKGNIKILAFYKTAFLCSQKCPADIVLKSYDWAKEQRANGTCIVCGNHSQIEKDVFEILLKGKQPLILVLARGMKIRWNPEIEKAVNAERLLIISPFKTEIKRVTRKTAKVRNEKIVDISNKIVVGYKTENGQLDKLLNGKKKNYSSSKLQPRISLLSNLPSTSN